MECPDTFTMTLLDPVISPLSLRENVVRVESHIEEPISIEQRHMH